MAWNSDPSDPRHRGSVLSTVEATGDAFGPELARQAMTLIFEGQRTPFEGRVRAKMHEALWFDSAEALAEADIDYFGPVARNARRLLGGFSKTNVAETTNVVWLDLDPPEACPNTHGALVANSEHWLDALRALGLAPAVYIFSGRGSWAYWKLDRHVSQVEAEALMRRIYAQFRPDGSEHDIGRIARAPGSTNEKTGLRAFVVAIENGRWAPDDLSRLLPDLNVPQASEAAGSALDYDRTLRPGGRLPAIELPDDLTEYLAAKPSKRERDAREIDGSSREQAIVSRLVNAGLLGPAGRALLRPPPPAPSRGREAPRPPLRLARHGDRQRAGADGSFSPEGCQNSDSGPGITRFPGITGVLKPLTPRDRARCARYTGAARACCTSPRRPIGKQVVSRKRGNLMLYEVKWLENWLESQAERPPTSKRKALFCRAFLSSGGRI